MRPRGFSTDEVYFVCRNCLADAHDAAMAQGEECAPWILGRQLEPEEGPEPCEWCDVGSVWDEVLYRPLRGGSPTAGD